MLWHAPFNVIGLTTTVLPLGDHVELGLRPSVELDLGLVASEHAVKPTMPAASNILFKWFSFKGIAGQGEPRQSPAGWA